ncbi:MAG: RNA polymerase sigma-70 factor [Cyclobacteriaceae bacterium]
MNKTRVKALFANIKDGDLRSFNMLYDAYKIKLFNFVYKTLKNKEDAEEIVQDTFVKLWQSKHLIVPEIVSDGYIYTIAKNSILNLLRKKFPATDSFEDLLQFEPVDNHTEEQIFFSDLSELSQSVINKMPHKRKLIYNLSRGKGYSNQEIADELNISKKTVEVQMTKALRFLRENILSIITLPFMVF